MQTIERRSPSTADRRPLLVTSLLFCCASSSFAQAPEFPLRNQNPFLQIYGLPPFQTAVLAADQRPDYRLTVDIANHADAASSPLEAVVLDGESYFLTLSMRHGISDRLELGVDVPLVAHTDGYLDNLIEGWHGAFGISNAKRRGPSNQLHFQYERAGATVFELRSPAAGIGDVQLSAAIALKRASAGDGRTLALRSSLKLPTGDAGKLLGSGAADFALGLYASDTLSLFERAFGLSGFAGAVLLGDGDVLPDIQRRSVPFAGLAATWRATGRLGLTAQLYAQGEYFDSDLEELGGKSLQLAVGGEYRMPLRGLTLLFAVVEDVSANATTDFGLHFSVRTSAPRQ